MPFIIAFLSGHGRIWAWRIRAAAAQVSAIWRDGGDGRCRAPAWLQPPHECSSGESVDEPALAIAGLGIAFRELSSLPTAEQAARR